LAGAQQAFGKSNLSVLAVNFGESAQAGGAIRKAAKAWHISLLEDGNGQIANSYGIHSIPHLFIVDRDGKIVANHTGYGDSAVDELVADLKGAMRG